MRPQLRRPLELLWAAGFLAAGIWHVATHRSIEISALAFAFSARCAWASTREAPQQAAHALGPGPLAPTPAGRFRATGWPPSRDPDDYR